MARRPGSTITQPPPARCTSVKHPKQSRFRSPTISTHRVNVSFKIKLWDNEGSATFLGGNREATVTVLDRDVVPRPRNPIDDVQAFVRQHYVDFLNREPDAEGLAFWIDQLTSCGDDARCIDIKRQLESGSRLVSRMVAR